ncbi:MAG TPA: hypothetical protein VMU94_28745 [Streptosporangiaceae bacterium]|nr:hypothetical protein [Streptosporangiaceae bacterium]
MTPESARPRGGMRREGPAFLRPLAGAVVALLMAGCGSGVPSAGSPHPPSGGTTTPGAVTVSSDHANGRTLHVKVGERLNLILSSTYWQVRRSSAPAVLRQDGAATPLPRPSSCPKIPGLGCTPVRTSFLALAPGTAVITASRTTCGEALRCAADQRHFRVTIVVR